MADNKRGMEQAEAQLAHIVEAMTKYNENPTDELMEEMQEMPLEVSFRSDWGSYGEELKPSEFQILLCTGGPAVRIYGGIDHNGQPYDAEIQGQDWFTQWQSLCTSKEDDEILEQFVQLIIPS
jgi:hypothetical protein